MKKILLILMAMLCMTASCAPGWPGQNTGDDASEGDVPRGGFFLKGRVTAIDGHIEVEVIKSEYAFGVHWVLVSDATVYENANGECITKSDLAVGDTVEIEYGGQVMMSYPPKIVAKSIQKL